MIALVHPAAVAATLTILIAALIGAVLLLRAWVGALADLVWIAVLRPRLTTGAVLGLTFAVLLIVYVVIPRPDGSPIALPLLIAVLLVPIGARPLVNFAARSLYDRNRALFELDEASLRLADVFSLEEMRLRTVYRPPAADPPAAP